MGSMDGLIISDFLNFLGGSVILREQRSATDADVTGYF